MSFDVKALRKREPLFMNCPQSSSFTMYSPLLVEELRDLSPRELVLEVLVEIVDAAVLDEVRNRASESGSFAMRADLLDDELVLLVLVGADALLLLLR